ncbi:MAG: acylphosphatase, partial [Candidatus Micrarchaeia archaeon]
QGVGYRSFVASTAKKYGIRGFVKNLPDGSVEILAYAQRETLLAFEKEITQYSEGMAEITGVEKTYDEKQNSDEDDFPDFTIEH